MITYILFALSALLGGGLFAAPAPHSIHHKAAPQRKAAGQVVAEAAPAPATSTPGRAGTAHSLTADEVVARVQSFYEHTDHLSALFRQTYRNTTFGRKSVSDGRVWIKKPGMMRWDYQGKRGGVSKSFISDGKVLWAIEYNNRQAFRKPLTGTVLPVAITFLTGRGKLSRDFRATLDTSGKYGATTDYVLKLVPKRPMAQYKTLWLVVDSGNFRVKQSIVLEASGNTNHFRFYEPNTKTPVKDSWFHVDRGRLRHYHIIEAKPSK